MKEVVKTNVKREQNSKRTRRRKKNKKLYIFLVFILVIGIGVILSVTLLFNISKINIKGEVDYSKENIIKASGIEMGDNLVRLDANEAEQRILSSMVYVESVDISKKYPDTLEIVLEKSLPAANAEYDGGILLLSPKGKILENVTEFDAELMVVRGMEPASFNQGQYITSFDKDKVDIYFEIIDALKECENSRVVSIDMTDKYNIKINYDNRIDFEAGSHSDIAYKIKLADTVLEDLKDGKKGTMIMIGANQISFRSENSMQSVNTLPTDENGRIPINEEDLPEDYSEAATEEIYESQTSYEETQPQEDEGMYENFVEIEDNYAE